MELAPTNYLLSDSDDGSDAQGFPTALWTWVYQKSGDYLDAMDLAKFQNWVNNGIIPTWKRRYPRFPCCLVAHGCMDDWISLDTILNGNHLGIQVHDENIRERIISSNPKYLSET